MTFQLLVRIFRKLCCMHSRSILRVLRLHSTLIEIRNKAVASSHLVTFISCLSVFAVNSNYTCFHVCSRLHRRVIVSRADRAPWESRESERNNSTNLTPLINSQAEVTRFPRKYRELLGGMMRKSHLPWIDTWRTKPTAGDVWRAWHSLKRGVQLLFRANVSSFAWHASSSSAGLKRKINEIK